MSTLGGEVEALGSWTQGGVGVSKSAASGKGWEGGCGVGKRGGRGVSCGAGRGWSKPVALGKGWEGGAGLSKSAVRKREGGHSKVLVGEVQGWSKSAA